MRKLATIRRIDALNPIEGADAIECASVGGWKVVAQKGLYKEGDLAVYFEVDSWIPHALAPFLSKGKEPREFEGVKGERLKTIKLRGQLSQGLLMPLKELYGYLLGLNDYFEGQDVTENLGILKWEKPVPAQLAGICRGNFPSLIPKTDQERCQNLVKEIHQSYEAGDLFEITEKLEGSSMTCYVIDGQFGVCSRNMDLVRDENNAFWKVAIAQNIEQKMLAQQYDFAIQGELVGPGVQGNIYKLSELDFYIFDIYNIKDGEYMLPENRRLLVEALELKHVPVISKCSSTLEVEDLLKEAEGKSALYNTEREGIVYKQLNGGFTFKAISNKYLLSEK